MERSGVRAWRQAARARGSSLSASVYEHLSGVAYHAMVSSLSVPFGPVTSVSP